MRAPSGLGRLGRMVARARRVRAGRPGKRVSIRKCLTRKPPEGLLFFWASRPIFVCSGGKIAMSATLRERLIVLIEPLLERLGYELVELEYSTGRTSAVVRLFIDRPEGIRVEDCERASRETAALLDVEDPIPTAYTLEVSSPGFDRVLRKPAHFVRFAGERVLVELKVPRAGRRRYTGTLVAVNDVGITLEVDKEKVEVPFVEIGKARLAS
jgi:ribosome maturation factor RimP